MSEAASTDSSTLAESRQLFAEGNLPQGVSDGRMSESGYTSQENGEASENNNEEFTIVTSVERSPIRTKHKSLTPFDNNSDFKDAVSDDFMIVAYLENDSQKPDVLLESGETDQNITQSNETGINSEVHTRDICNKRNEASNTINDISNNSNDISNYSNDTSNNSNDISNNSNDIINNSNDISNNSNDVCNNVAPVASHDTRRRIGNDKNRVASVIIEGEEVELRKSRSSGNGELLFREPTWRTNQKYVSNAFGFLKDIDGGRDTIAVTSAQLCDDDPNSSVSGDSTPVYAKVNKTKALRREPAVNDYEMVVLNSSPLLQTSGENMTRDIAATSYGDDLGELPERATQLRNRRKPRQSHEAEDDDGGSSDEDKGVYQESFRKSTWLYVGPKDGGPKGSDYVSLADLNVKSCDEDSIFGDEPMTKHSKPPHQRNDSTDTTASEIEFRNTYNSVSKRYVQRSDSQQQYQRMTARFYEREKTLTLTKDERNSGYGIHILDSQPAVITGVDAGSPAEAAGVKEGQIVVSINDINVLEAKHEEILQLVSQKTSQLVLEVGHSDISHLRNLQEPVLTGILQKQTSSAIFKMWKRRFFILRRDHCLYYYKNEQETDPLGAIPLKGYTFSRHGVLSKFGFKAEKYSNRTYYFLADSRADMTRWVGALNQSVIQGKHKKDSWMDVTAENVGLPALEIRKPDCSGYIYKMGRATRRWYKRYCVLKDACIYYYKNSSSREAEGVAHLHGYIVNSTGVSGKKQSFSLLPPESQMRVFSFATDNETDKLRWVEAMSTSIDKWVKVD